MQPKFSLIALPFLFNHLLEEPRGPLARHGIRCEEMAPHFDTDTGVLAGGGSRQASGWPLRSERGQWEALNTTLWDTLNMPLAGVAELNFFTVPASPTKNRVLTNLNQSSRLSGGSSFDIHSIRFEVVDALTAGILEDEAREILHSGFLELEMSQQRYNEWPLTQLPAGGGVAIAGTTGTNATPIHAGVNNGQPSSDAVQKLFTTIRIPRNVDFQVNCFWNPVPTPTVIRPLRVVLEGILWRKAKPKGA
jgi:hypothetical protein